MYCKECDCKLFSDFYKDKGKCPDCLDEDTSPKELEERLPEFQHLLK